MQAVLIAAAGLTALVPATRIRVPGDWQDMARPYIIHQPVTVRPTETHNGLQALRIWDIYQVSVFSATFSSGRAVVEQVIAALRGAHSDMYGQWRPGLLYIGRDDEQDVFEFAVDFLLSEVYA